jgi:ribosome-binding protein aMBF1 (putative translation factor)
MKSFSKFKQELLKDKSVKKEYQKLGSEFKLARIVIEKRLAKGMTQATLAHKAGTKQSAIARLESGNYNPTLLFIEKIADALDTKLDISFS